MRLRQVVAVIALALAAGLVGLFAGSFVGGRGPPPWLIEQLMRSDIGVKLARHWIDATVPAAPSGVRAAIPGERRPDAAFVDIDGRQRMLAEWDGQPLLLNFWASWCGPCREEMPALDRIGRDTPLAVVGVALDDADAVRRFLATTPVHYPILVASSGTDPSAAFGNLRGALPYSVLIGRDGRILRQRLGGLDAGQLRDWADLATR